MKLTVFFLLVTALHVSARGYGQGKITLSVKDAPIEKVFKMILEQSGYDYMGDYTLLQQAKSITLQLKEATLTEALDQCFEDQPITYEIQDKIIIVKPIPKPIIESSPTGAPPHDIQGKVTSETGSPLDGAAILIKGTKRGTQTNTHGEFILKNVDGNAVLVISFTGYSEKTIQLNGQGQTFIEVKLSLSTNPLDQAQVIAYGSVSKRLNTGDVSTIQAETIAQQPVADPIGALEGRIPGLLIQQNSGVPGAGYTIQLRGINSIANGNLPLFIVDGVPFNSTTLSDPSLAGSAGVATSPFNNIPPGDIERIDVLKDADATAIYGSRGANGVVLITTKKGKAGDTKVDLGGYTGLGVITRKMPLLNTNKYLAMRHEAFQNDGESPQSDDYDVNGAWDTTRNTDWQKELIGHSAQMTNLNAAVSGGNDQTQFFIGGAYQDQGTVFPGNFGDNRVSVHAGISNTSRNKRFKTSFSAGYSVDNNELPLADPTYSILLAPDAPPIYTSAGQLNWQQSTWTNPFGAFQQIGKTVTENLLSSLQLSYVINNSLQFNLDLNYNNIQANQTNTSPLSSNDPAYQQYIQAELDLSHDQIHTWNAEPQLNFDRRWGKSKFHALFGTTFLETQQSQLGQVGLGFASDALLQNLQAASTIIVVTDINTDYRYSAGFTRLSYNYDDKYLLNLTGRRDGSSRFGPSERIANFGAVGAGWIFSKESFVQQVLPALSFGKLRCSYGLTGNDQIGDYQYLSSYSTGTYPYQGLQGLYPTRLANPYYAWEVNRKLEFGLELGFMQDRIHASASYYDNHSSNQLVSSPLPAITGFTSITANLPAKVQNEGWEFEMISTNVKTAKFSWTTNLNLTISSNKLLAFPNLEGSSYANQYQVGKSLQISKVFHETGVDPQAGTYLFEKQSSHTPTSSPAYPDDLIAVNLFARYYGGILNTITYRQFELNFFFQYVVQKGRNYVSHFGMPGGFNDNQPVYVLDRWQRPGDAKPIQRFAQDYGSAAASIYYNYYESSDAGIGDASFLRLKNLSLAYRLPAGVLNRWGVRNIRCFVQGQNLFTITHYPGLDPENKGLLPPLRMLTAGFTISL